MAAKKRVLIVDDNADAVAVLAVAIRRGGHEVHEAFDGRSALEAARRVRPDFIFLDIALPRLDGFGVVRQIRSDPALASTRVIAITGFAQDRDREEAQKAGFDQFLVKPIDLGFVDSLLG